MFWSNKQQKIQTINWLRDNSIDSTNQGTGRSVTLSQSRSDQGGTETLSYPIVLYSQLRFNWALTITY